MTKTYEEIYSEQDELNKALFDLADAVYIVE